MMRASCLLLLMFLVAACATRAALGEGSRTIAPEIAVGLTSKNIGGSKAAVTEVMGIFEPNVRFTTGRSFGAFDCEGGLNIKSGEYGEGSIPYSLWGKVKRSIKGWNMAARVDCESEDLHCLDLDVRVDHAQSKARVQATVDTVSRTGEVTELGISQSLNVPGNRGCIMLSPSYRVPSRKANLVVSYQVQDTVLTLAGGIDKQKMTICQKFGDNNAIAPTVTSDGEIDLEYRRNVGNGLVTGAYKPNDALRVKYQEGPWVAGLDVPLAGLFKIDDAGAKVSLKRTVVVEKF